MTVATTTTFTGYDRVLLGVARAVALRFGIEPVAVRLAFVALGVAGGWGILLYLALWLFWLPEAPKPIDEGSQAPATVRTVGVVLALVGSLLILRDRIPGFHDGLVWPVALVASGLMLAWHQLIPTSPAERRSSPAGSGLLRVGGGALLLVAGLTFLLAANLSINAARDAIVASTVVATGLLLMFGPWVLRLTRTAAQERARRIRADERAEVAAHLHDSVLQTLALMQKRSEDPAAMASLARRQERELRRWLYGGPSPSDGDPSGSLVEELEGLAAEVEDQHQVRIDPVTVGNTPMVESLRPLVAATREALVNAAKFSGERQLALYAQVSQEACEVYVRDRGQGFVRADVPADRHGLTESIEGRMQRAGGRATVRTAPGAGTEVHLVLPRHQAGDHPTRHVREHPSEWPSEEPSDDPVTHPSEGSGAEPGQHL